MGGKRLAMVAVRESWRTPWVVATGKEVAARVKGLGEGDLLRMMVDLGDPQMLHIIALHEGDNSLLQDPAPRLWKRYMLDKNTNTAESATSVEVLLGNDR